MKGGLIRRHRFKSCCPHHWRIRKYSKLFFLHKHSQPHLWYQSQAQAQVSDYIYGPDFALHIYCRHMAALEFLWFSSFLTFLTFLGDRLFFKLNQNPSAVLCQTSTFEPPHRGHFDLYVHVILVVGSQLQTTGTQPYVGFTWNWKYIVNAYTWNVIYMVKWDISCTYYCSRFCCCIHIQLTNALTNFAIRCAQIIKFLNLSTCAPWHHWKHFNPNLQYFENCISLLLTWVLNQVPRHLQAGTLSTRPNDHGRINEKNWKIGLFFEDY